ncbi:transcriptional regulator with XRE-family HTH domain [Saccharothrix tamanrassetensis]|uniref:Transcriptional regulator with XRE-family HTH domain n=1 Tax=Saccharothrix tamanrassetensis TaxID=1051531 RepID=A0A841CEW4_9PSEU|nr:helix-turn-helix transcriptional regulator [Saccharothrix tamanrassetensis]MBB5955520.1 transcriptional regulator with XRE-family HTH domain [Saccharothrix tamanrassetensis]
MPDAQQTVERMQLGLALQELRQRAGRSQQEAGTSIGKSYVRISQVEHGKGALKHHDLLTLLDFYDATAEERETILAIGVEARRRAPKRSYTDVLPEAFQRLADLQANASQIRQYTSGTFPGLIQSPDYVRALIKVAGSVWYETDEAEAKVAFRLEQQRRVLEAARPKVLTFVFTEDALSNTLGDASVMQGQILHVLQLMAKHPAMTVQVLPSGTADNPALGGSLIILDFVSAPRIGYAPAIYGPTTYYNQPSDTQPMGRAFERVHELALSPEASKALLIESLKET